MYLQKVRKTMLSIFVEKRNFLNEFESIPWERIWELSNDVIFFIDIASLMFEVVIV